MEFAQKSNSKTEVSGAVAATATRRPGLGLCVNVVDDLDAVATPAGLRRTAPLSLGLLLACHGNHGLGQLEEHVLYAAVELGARVVVPRAD